MALPYADDLASQVLRIDFSDDSAWEALRMAIDAADDTAATYIDDKCFADASIQTLVDEDAASEEDDKITYVFLADAVTMTDPTRPLLSVDLYDDPGRSFRVPVEWNPEISANLSIADMDFADSADCTDGSDTFRGW
ncbi:DUF6924 domain-containing protein [Streptomyces sp. MI02-7b]|uniref:DUF6924 domain-containing protein n=1 Tax=Streptomyces sp. MI02-7b TaxID=462941 RepID=UPI0029ACAA2A|nr:hypothetical protein [Streptomyces sp. MI02-7b]MDX3077668.1 hypothetical protein [Streptomyces sp. MI02-7b]